MTIWARIVEGVQELSWGNLFGLEDPSMRLLDADATRTRQLALAEDQARADERPQSTKQVGFTIAVIALGAKMAKADGTVSAVEIDAFHEVFQAPPEERANVEFFFNLARRSMIGAETYARQVKRLLGEHKSVLEDLMGALFHIAKADGVITPAEDEYLRQIAEIFGFEERCYRRLRAYHVGSEHAPVVEEDPYLILGVDPWADMDTIKKRWRELARDNHPDRAMADGLPAEFISIATTKLALINAAYDRLVAQHEASQPKGTA
ncbi:molecular chaperone DjlA [Aliidongia dinghuensis]|uniref:Molecular chaperone DjlA n=1 Tax=Aliidongia dinghuensis TaxID=1867774 RepID=A0A8J2YTB3_9PROT|nr:molecular chaperone DjiA [Aliidongia dinghuensis]GGF17548.1 molecular chaperone DjlA [Aliidongia dinghuensis]